MSTLATIPSNGSDVSTKRNTSTLPGFSSWVDNLLESGMGTGFLTNFNTGMTLPAVNIKENSDEFFLEIAVLGMKKSDFTTLVSD